MLFQSSFIDLSARGEQPVFLVQPEINQPRMSSNRVLLTSLANYNSTLFGGTAALIDSKEHAIVSQRPQNELLPYLSSYCC